MPFVANWDRQPTTFVRSWIEHDLSELLTLFQALVGPTRFAQGIRAVDHSVELAAEDVPKHFMKIAHRSHIGTEE